MKKSFFLLLVILPTAASAFFAEVIVDVGRERINAIEGVVHVPLGVPIHSVYTGHSAVLIWLKEPVFDEEKRTIAFSGITPGGGLYWKGGAAYRFRRVR